MIRHQALGFWSRAPAAEEVVVSDESAVMTRTRRPDSASTTAVVNRETPLGAGVDPGARRQSRDQHHRRDGGYAEQAVVDAASVIPVPDGLRLVDAVAVLAGGRTAVALMRGAQVWEDDPLAVSCPPVRLTIATVAAPAPVTTGVPPCEGQLASSAGCVLSIGRG